MSYITSFSTGVLLHLSLFRFGEWDLYTPHFLAGATILPGIATFGLLHLGGPFLARLSNVYITSLSVKKFHLFEEVQSLHAKYGDIVRVGPSELSIANPNAYHLIHSNQSPCEKGPWYNILHPVKSLHMLRDRKEHALRRKTWDKGLGTKALRDYEPRVEEYTQQLLSFLKKKEGSPVDVSTLFNFYSFDVMGDLAFGKGFDMLKEDVVHYYMTSVHANMLAVSAFSHLVWIFPLLKAIPGLNREHIIFQSWLTDQVSARRAMKIERPDLFSWLLADYESAEKPTAQNLIDLHGDAHLIVVAGSDTTAASLTCLFFELAQNPSVLQQLYEELDQYFAENEQPTATTLSKLDYLSACINETLRLHPPVPSGLQRMTPPEGLQLEGTYIPGDTIVQVPTYTLHRDERAFVQPNEFIPERWTSKPELVKDVSVFSPFGTAVRAAKGQDSTGAKATARKLKKRELDRKAQRLARERTKNRIHELESMVELLKADAFNPELFNLVTTLNQVKQQRDELQIVTGSPNTWRNANTALGKTTALSPAQLAIEDFTSEDTPVRVILDGWDNVAKAGHLK
ncbi:hypothetical protein DV737_g2605, partial [Chaetothyriales sp. CBS 132003]